MFINCLSRASRGDKAGHSRADVNPRGTPGQGHSELEPRHAGSEAAFAPRQTRGVLSRERVVVVGGNARARPLSVKAEPVPGEANPAADVAFPDRVERML